MTLRDTLTQIGKQLAPKIDAAMTNEVFEAVREEESATIYDEVYKVYTPHSKHCKPYERRGQYEGMADPYNIEIRGGAAKDGTLVVVNTTEPNPGGVGVDFVNSVTTNKNLPMLIEYGGSPHGRYDFAQDPARRYLKPRPLTTKTIEHLKDNRAHVDAMRVGLKKRGVKVKEGR